MENLVLTLHIVVCVILVLLVLLQSGKEGMGVIFGGGSGSLFGSSGAGGVLVKLTTFVALLFVATSLGYNILTAVKPSKEATIMDISVDDAPAPVMPAIPATPEAPKPDAAAPAAPAQAPAATPAPAEAPAATPAPAEAPAAPANAPAQPAASDAQAPPPAKTE